MARLFGKRGDLLGAEVDGIEGLMADFRGYEKEAEQAIDKAVAQTATAIQKTAKGRVEGRMGSKRHWGTGLLSKSIMPRMNKMMDWQVGTSSEYAAYIEFGTGDEAFKNFPFDAEARQVASSWWSHKKWKGAKGDSFLNYAAVEQQPKLIERIKTELNKINKTK
jgi:hypothetical protein